MESAIPILPLIVQIENIRREMIAQEWAYADLINTLQPHYRNSARNLIHYLTLRRFDLRNIQEDLSSLGISSIGHSERYTLTNIINILHLLHLLDGKKSTDLEASGLRFSLSYPRSKMRFLEHTEKLFGPARYKGHTRIMVTLPSEAAEDDNLIKNLLLERVEILRINCSHDDQEAWSKMIRHIRTAEKETGNKCLIYMDLGGPKIRTGPLATRISRNREKRKTGRIILRNDDTLWLLKNPILGHSSVISDEGELVSPGSISITLPEIFDDIRPGESIWFDDGKIGGLIEQVESDRALIRITHAGLKGATLREDKGINLPETSLSLPSLTEEDLRNLPFITKHADMVGYSFVRKPRDVQFLQEKLKELGREDISIILKIETQESFDNLPLLLIEAMKSPSIGVMIARGDLAVEVGWTRIAEVQEQIMWLCEAAQIPYIWATQILESLAKDGLATRAEITDAAIAARAECAMLNKGPYIMEAIRTLRNIDNRMIAHHQKKMGALRPLHVAERFFRHHADSLKPSGMDSANSPIV